MGRILFLVFLAVPLIEIACFIVIGQAIGLWPTLAGVLITAVAGALVLRWQGTALISEIRATLGQGRLPARAMADAMLVGIAGLLLLLPGYFSDLIGILLLIPPVRSLIYAVLARRFKVVTPATPTTAPGAPRRIDLDPGEWRGE